MLPTNPGLVRLRRIELLIQHVGPDRQCMVTGGGVYKLAFPNRAQTVLAHQTAHPVVAHHDASRGERRPQTAAAVNAPTCCKRYLQWHTGLPY